MDINPDELNVINNEAKNRFEVQIGDAIAFAEYNLAGKNMVFTHTEVPKGFEGQGVGSKLAYVALEHAKAQGYKVQPLCPFINLYVSRHPEYHDISWGY